MPTFPSDPSKPLPSNDYFDNVLRPPEEPPVVENDINDFIKANNLTDSPAVRFFTYVMFGMCLLAMACVMAGIAIWAIRWGLGLT